MQLAPCGTLGQWIRHLGKISEFVLIPTRIQILIAYADERDTKIIAAQLCSALSFLHDANIIHRDIKPAVSSKLCSTRTIHLISFPEHPDPIHNPRNRQSF